MDLMT